MGSNRLSAVLSELAKLPDFAGVASPSLTMRSPAGNTPLHVAATRGDTQSVRVLLEEGADPNAVGEHGCTPLHQALKQEHLQVARILVAAGASLDAKDGAGVTCRDMTKVVSLWETQH